MLPFFIEICAGQLKNPKNGKSELPAHFSVLGVGLPEMDDTHYRSLMKKAVQELADEDGHIASLFHEDGALLEKQHLTRAVTSKGLKHPRITLTLPVINHAKNIFLVATGKRKANVIKEILGKRNPQFPASLVRPEKGQIIVLLDRQSASLI